MKYAQLASYLPDGNKSPLILLKIDLASAIKDHVVMHGALCSRWNVMKLQDMTKSKNVVAKELGGFASDQLLQLFRGLVECFEAGQIVYGLLNYDSENIHLTDYEVREFMQNVKTGDMSERELVYFNQKRCWNRDYVKAEMVCIFSDLLKFYTVIMLAISELLKRSVNSDDCQDIYECWRQFLKKSDIIERIVSFSTKNLSMAPTPDFRIYHAPESIDEPMATLEKLLTRQDYETAHSYFHLLQESMRVTLAKMLSQIPAGVNNQSTPPRR